MSGDVERKIRVGERMRVGVGGRGGKKRGGGKGERKAGRAGKGEEKVKRWGCYGRETSETKQVQARRDEVREGKTRCDTIEHYQNIALSKEISKQLKQLQNERITVMSSIRHIWPYVAVPYLEYPVNPAFNLSHLYR